MIYNNTIVILTKKITHIFHQKVFLRNISTYKGTVHVSSEKVSETVSWNICWFPFFPCEVWNFNLISTKNRGWGDIPMRFIQYLFNKLPFADEKTYEQIICVYNSMTNRSYLYISTHRCASYIIGWGRLRTGQSHCLVKFKVTFIRSLKRHAHQ